MEIKTQVMENSYVVAPQGRIDTLTSEEVEAALNACPNECENVVLDMAAVDYVSSAGIRVIIQAHQKYGKEHFCVKSVSKNVKQLLTMTGFDRVLNFED